MAMVLAGIGSLVAHEIGALALNNAPILKQAGTEAVINVAKKSFDLILDNNPNFSNFLGHFGIHKFNQSSNYKTFAHRGRHRRITYGH